MDVIPAHVVSGHGMDDKQSLLIECACDLDVFNRTFMPKAFSKRTPMFHRIMHRDLLDKSIKKLGFIAPRGSAKSTTCTISFPMREMLFNGVGDDLLIMAISETQDQSIKYGSVIKWNLENNALIRYYFGNMVGRKWTDEEFCTTNNARFIAKGTGQRVRGTLTGTESIQRPNLIILDDFESETNTLTAEAMQKNKEWISAAVEPSMADDGRLIAVGTIIAMNAFLVDIQEDPAWKTHFFQAMMNADLSGEGNIPIWPERYDRKKLLDLKASYDARGMGHVWWREYMNVPINMDRQDFRQQWIKYFDHEFKIIDGQPSILDKATGMIIPLEVTIGLDPAVSLDSAADWTCITAVGQSSEEEFFTLDQHRLRSNDSVEIVKEFLDMAQEYSASVISVETTQFQEVLEVETYRQMDALGVYFGIDTQKPRTQKNSRIRSLQPTFKNGKAYLRSWMNPMEQELLTFPKGKHDDTLDSWWLAWNISTPCTVKPYKAVEENRTYKMKLRQPGKLEGEKWLVT